MTKANARIRDLLPKICACRINNVYLTDYSFLFHQHLIFIIIK